MEKLKMRSPDLTDKNIARLAELFPNCVTEAVDDDGKQKTVIDFDQLRQELSGNIADGHRERYHLDWPGKKAATLAANSPIASAVRPCREESVAFNSTENIFIEGDNLEALKLLQETCLNKVKMIYIDPPYNTGNDFIYDDDFAEDSSTYFERSHQTDSVGNRLVTNSESNGRFHSDWLSMMFSRLRLARNLLAPNGVLFVSIDDGEVSPLKLLCDEVFGAENFINQIAVLAKPSSGASGGGEDVRLKKNIEYLLCYSRSRTSFERFNDVFDEKRLLSYIKEYKEEGKSWKYTRVLTSLGTKKFYSEVSDGSGKPIKIFQHTGVEIATLKDLAQREGLSEEQVHLKYFDRIFRDTNAQSSIRQRVLDATDREDTFYSIEYIPTSGRSKGQVTTLYYKGRNKDLIAWLSDVASSEGGRLLKKEKVGTLWTGFNWNNVSKEGDVPYPNGKKPIAFIQRMLSLCTSPEDSDVVLDFFAGSGSVAHAVVAQNVSDGGNRTCISIQIAEEISDKDRKKYYSDSRFTELRTICDIFKLRMRQAGRKLKEENATTAPDLDVGFRVLKVDSSNMKDVYYAPDGVTQGDLLDQIENIKEDRTPEDLLFQVLLDWGVDLSLPIAEETIEAKTVYFIDGNALAACFDKDINEELVKTLAARKPLRAVFRDSGYGNDSVKINVEQIFKLISPSTEVKSI
jgi:adenine-specific DNA-methyltransferase